MRILLAGAAAIALSGCSFLGLGGNQDYKNYGYNAHTGNYGYQAQRPAPKTCTSGPVSYTHLTLPTTPYV